MEKRFCKRCGSKAIKITEEEWGYSEKTGERNKKVVYYCTSESCTQHKHKWEKIGFFRREFCYGCKHYISYFQSCL